MNRSRFHSLLGCWPLALLLLTPLGYPVDGYEYSGIRRLERLRLRLEGELEGPVPVKGGRKSIRDTKLHLIDTEGLATKIRSIEPDLQRRLENLFSGRDESYSIAILDVSPDGDIRSASLRGSRPYQPGSVGKLAIAAGLFTELQALYPQSVEPRRRILRERTVVADEWIQSDHHRVPLFDLEDKTVGSRPIEKGDGFSLYEWVDHMLSASSNAAASTVWKEAMLMRAFGREYPPTRVEEDAFFEDTGRKELQGIALSVVNDPLRELGIDERDWKLGSFFTRNGKSRVPSAGSTATPNGLLSFLIAVEQGRLVDAWSSLELKRLMYMTERRIRYASSPRLTESAVYFKSGSLYKCEEEPDFECGRYKGNVFNYMNSVAIVEKPDGRIYLVALMSNVLRVNAAVEHQTLATSIDEILTR